MDSREPLNILLVDDQPAKLLSYETVLASLGENLIRANSGKEALECLLKQDIAVVLVDVCMPELDGFELASMIRQHPRFGKTAIILVSGVLVEDTHRLRGYDSGAVDYVSVPIIPEILRAKVAVFADLYRKTVELQELNEDLEKRVTERTAEIEILLAKTEDARREAEEANRLKDEFLAILSHELRTPLNAITGWAALLQAGDLEPETQIKAVETINRNVALQTRLISDILDVSRITSGKLLLEIKPVDLPSIIHTAIETNRLVAEAKNIQIEEVVTGVDEPILGDPARLQQIVWNLLSNATKFTPANGHVQIGLRKAGADVELTVQDDGPGIPDALLPCIFEPFRQADASSVRAHRGLGLGLTIVRNLVELHGGRIDVMNRPDRSGAIFKVTLPVHSTSPESLSGTLEAEPAASKDANWFQTAPRLKGIRVLVVDDEADAREVIASVFERCGAEVRLASSVLEALGEIEQKLPDVLLADIAMPGEDGNGLIRKVRALPSDQAEPMIAIALTAYASEQDRRRSVDAGFNLHVSKPVQPLELSNIVSRLIRSKYRETVLG